MFHHNPKLYDEVCREFSNNWYQVDGYYREQIQFKHALLTYIFSVSKLNTTRKVATVVHQILKSFLFKELEHRRGIYKHIRYVVLPALWKDHRAIERKKQRKLTFLANELHNDGRVVEAHVVRTIVKPYIRDLNRKWSKMSALDKLKNEKSNV